MQRLSYARARRAASDEVAGLCAPRGQSFITSTRTWGFIFNRGLNLESVTGTW